MLKKPLLKPEVPSSVETDVEIKALTTVSSAPDTIPYFTGTGTASAASFTPHGRSIVATGSISATQGLLNLTPGTNVQAQNPNLQAIANLTSSANKFPVFTGSGTASAATVTQAAKSLLDDSSVAEMQSTLDIIPKATVTAQNDFIVGSGAGAVTKKTLAETKTLLGLDSLGTASTLAAESDNISSTDNIHLPTSLAVRTYFANNQTAGGIRQTVLSGATDEYGISSFFNVEYVNGVTKGILQASNNLPLTLSISDGPREKVVSITSTQYIDLTSYINSTSTEKKYYVYADLDNNNSLTYGITPFRPNYGYKSKSKKCIVNANTCGFTAGQCYISTANATYPTSNWNQQGWIITNATGAGVNGQWFAWSGMTQKIKTIVMMMHTCPDFKIQWSSNSTNGSDGTWTDILSCPSTLLRYYWNTPASSTFIQLPDYAASGSHWIRMLATTGLASGNWQFYNLMLSPTEVHAAIETNSVQNEGVNWLNRDTCIYSASSGAADANAGWTALFDKRQTWYWYAGAAGAQWYGVKDVPNTNPVKKVRMKCHDNNAYHAYGTMQWSPDGTTWNDIPNAVQISLTDWTSNQVSYSLWSEIPVPDYTPTGGTTHRFRMIVTQAPTGTNHYAWTNGWYVYEAEIMIASDYYSIPDGKFYKTDGTAVKRIYLGEFYTNDNYITKWASYAIMGKFESPWRNCGANGSLVYYTGIHDAQILDWQVFGRYADFCIGQIASVPTTNSANNAAPFVFQYQNDYVYLYATNILHGYINGYNQYTDYTAGYLTLGTAYLQSNNAAVIAYKIKVNRGW